MIVAEALTKQFGVTRAVDRISFRVGRGEVVGFLGPNGAGKTTTMRMLTTYIAATSGRAVLAGHDVLDEPIAVRRHVGYLPENVPLYDEMRVREFLDFRARLRDLPRRERILAIDRVLGRCHLDDVQDRLLGQLSKGYRQRVGLADAMVHDPDILILDEPTAGLDPIQILEVRDLIRELAENHTILLSTHILQEVEAVCSRVILIVRGRIAIDDRLDRLRAESSILVEARGPAGPIGRVLETHPAVDRVARRPSSGADLAAFEVVPRPGLDPREGLAKLVVDGGFGLLRLEMRRSTLEDRFIEAVHSASMRPEALEQEAS